MKTSQVILGVAFMLVCDLHADSDRRNPNFIEANTSLTKSAFSPSLRQSLCAMPCCQPSASWTG